MSTTVRFSVPEFDRMIQAGVFAERANQRIELIYGEMREVNPPNPPHEDIVDKLMYWSMDRAPRDQVRIRIQNSLGIPALDSLTIPDVAWMVARDYHRQRPEPADVLLLIEVADSTLQSDRKEKGPLYAAAGIQEYWIVNVTTSVWKLIEIRWMVHIHSCRQSILATRWHRLRFPNGHWT
ncbi:MAG: Uma2 family endonuclease [Planctomycetales bacterium]|nr:Uma2 family endonuclease [Planctomycetales bacterium]